MSKLSELLVARETGSLLRNLGPISHVCKVVDDYRVLTHNTLVEYEIVTTIGCKALVSQGDRKAALPFAVMQAKRSVIEAVFGEFRADFWEVQRLLSERGIEEASRKLYDMKRKMFDL